MSTQKDFSTPSLFGLDPLMITVQTLRVNGRQMSQAFFRQVLQRQDTATSQKWGRVNFEGRWWLVFSENGMLYRLIWYGYDSDPERLTEQVNTARAALAEFDAERPAAEKRGSSVFYEKHLAWLEEKRAKLVKNLHKLEADYPGLIEEDRRQRQRAAEIEALPQLFIVG